MRLKDNMAEKMSKIIEGAFNRSADSPETVGCKISVTIKLGAGNGSVFKSVLKKRE